MIHLLVLSTSNVEESNNQMKRYLSAFLLSAGLLVSVAAVKADDDHHPQQVANTKSHTLNHTRPPNRPATATS